MLDGYAALPEAERRAKAAGLAPTLRSIASFDKPMVGHFSDDPRVLEFLASTEHPRLAGLGTSCPDHFLRTKVKPLVLDLPASASVEESITRLTTLHEEYRADYQGYYDRNATPDSPGDSGGGSVDHSDPGGGHVLLRGEQADRPGGRGVLSERDQCDARRGRFVHVCPDR